jgi:cysteine-rich repeat protein
VLARDGDGVADACAASDTNVVLPGACAGSADLAACVARRAVCRACRAETATDHVGADCDLRADDGESNDSCPNTFVQPCGNGVLDPGEECDDHNLSDADCCSSACTPVAAGAPCPDDADLCTTDLCTGTGVCAHASQCAWAFTDGTDAAEIDVVHSYDETRSRNPELEAAIEAGGAAAADYDGDGWVDLYFVGGTDGANYLLHNEGDGTFEDRAAAAGVALAGTMSCGPVFRRHRRRR